MKYKRNIILIASLLFLSLIPVPYAQETERAEGPQDVSDSTGDAPISYRVSTWYFLPPSPQKKGVSFFSTGYNYFYNNFDINITMLELGITKNFYVDTSIRTLFYGLMSLDMGYQLRYPFQFTKYKLMEHVGYVGVGLYQSNIIFNNESQIGRMNFYAQKTNALQSMRSVKNTTSLTALFVDIPDILRFDAEFQFIYDYAIDYDEHLYEVYFNTTVVQDHGFGHIAIKPFVSYANSFGMAQEIKAQKNILQHTTFSIFAPVSFYNFAGGALMEYRFFFLSFLKTYQWYEDFYISAAYNVAYIKDDTRTAGEVKMYYGGGIGFNLFGSVPFSVQFLVDEDAHMGFSIISGIISPY